jgi:hypothetical protein
MAEEVNLDELHAERDAEAQEEKAERQSGDTLDRAEPKERNDTLLDEDATHFIPGTPGVTNETTEEAGGDTPKATKGTKTSGTKA